MDYLERIGELPARLAATLLAIVVLGAACVSGDQTAATFDDDAGDLPTTAPSPDSTAADEEASSEPDDSPTTSTSRATETTEPLPPLQGLDSELIADGFDQPILVASAPGTDLLYVVEREGIIKTVDDGTVAETPFLDLSDRLLSNSIEQGLLGLAFHPSYADSGRFFAYWTDPEGDSVLAEFNASNPTEADPDSMNIVLQVDQPAERHNAGSMQFGPDGLLYLALGDGGSGGATAQDTSNPLGSIVRIDVDRSTTDRSFAIPEGNPFDDEIWVYGLRNPWRFSIDPLDELIYIGDVGQDGFEEINVIGLDEAGTNFGWFEMEGDRCFRPGCDESGKTPPVLQYSHDEGCSVTGGWVYRGAAIPEFDGHYFFGDWCVGFVRSMKLVDDQVTEQRDWTSDLDLGQVTSFGPDGDGELHVSNWDGEIHKIVPIR